MNTIIAALSFIGATAVACGAFHVLFKGIEYLYEVRRILHECREALRRVEQKR